MNEQLKKIQKYIDTTMEDIEVLMEKHKRHMKLQTLVLITMLITLFSTSFVLWVIVFNLWLFLFFYENFYILRPLNKKFGNLEGCFKVLRILGLFDDAPKTPKKKKKRKSRKMLEAFYGEMKKITDGISWKKEGYGFT